MQKWAVDVCIEKTYLPIFVSSSSSDGARLFRRHNVAITPICNVKQHTKSMISNSKRTAPTATAIIEADVTGFAGTTRSRPIKKIVSTKKAECRFDRFHCYLLSCVYVCLFIYLLCSFIFIVSFRLVCFDCECTHFMWTYNPNCVC